MKRPVVSVILPTYNRVDRLAVAMASVKRQTFEDWELIIVDDCSTDNTKQVISSWKYTDDRIRHLETRKNSGSPVIPRNLGCGHAFGKYLAFLDSDDSWRKEKLETQVGYLEATGEAFSYHDLLVRYEDRRSSVFWSKMSTCHSGEVFPFLLKKNFVPTSSVVIRKDVYDKYGPMDMSLDISHDWDLWLKVAFEYQLHFIPDILVGTLDIHSGTVISEAHKRRKESRRVVKRWTPYVDGMWYRKIMLYYYVMEIFDILPYSWQQRIRARWYKQERYK